MYLKPRCVNPSPATLAVGASQARLLAATSMFEPLTLDEVRLRYAAQQNPPLTIEAIAYGLARLCEAGLVVALQGTLNIHGSVLDGRSILVVDAPPPPPPRKLLPPAHPPGCCCGLCIWSAE